jgi:hypothetical protein
VNTGGEAGFASDWNKLRNKEVTANVNILLKIQSFLRTVRKPDSTATGGSPGILPPTDHFRVCTSCQKKIEHLA